MAGRERRAHRQVWQLFAVLACLGLLGACGPADLVTSTDGGEQPPSAAVRIRPPEWAPVLVEPDEPQDEPQDEPRTDAE